MNLSRYQSREYAWFRTSPEILAAIDAIFRGDVRDPDGQARLAWEIGDGEAVLAYVNQHFSASRKFGDVLRWITDWATYDGTAFIRFRPMHIARVAGRPIIFNCPNQFSLDRAKSLLTKEPGTIAWIDGFELGSSFWDIGANIGTFSLYAACKRGCFVTAFEPAAGTYQILQNNIVVNGLDRQVSALPVAIDEQCRVSSMHMRDSEPGSALHVFGKAVDYTGAEFQAHHLQGAIGVSIDALCSVFNLQTPNYVKIDVDGLELDVIRGGQATFAQRSCRSVLVEIDLNDAHEVGGITDILNACGLRRDDTVPGNVGRPHGKVLVYNMIFKR